MIQTVPSVCCQAFAESVLTKIRIHGILSQQTTSAFMDSFYHPDVTSSVLPFHFLPTMAATRICGIGGFHLTFLTRGLVLLLAGHAGRSLLRRVAEPYHSAVARAPARVAVLHMNLFLGRSKSTWPRGAIQSSRFSVQISGHLDLCSNATRSIGQQRIWGSQPVRIRKASMTFIGFTNHRILRGI